jgi:hypothetical protein
MRLKGEAPMNDLTQHSYDQQRIILPASWVLHIGNTAVFPLVCGPRVGTQVVDLLNAQFLFGGPYRESIERAASAWVRECPQVTVVLQEANGADRLAEIIHDEITGRVESEVLRSGWPLLEIHATAERMVQKFKDFSLGAEERLAFLLDQPMGARIPLEEQLLLLANVFPLSKLGLGNRELRRLIDALGLSDENFGHKYLEESLRNILAVEVLQLIRNPLRGAKYGEFRKNSPLWNWGGLESPPETLEEWTDFAIDLFSWALEDIDHVETLIGYMVGHQLRRENGLNTGRGHETVSLTGFEQVCHGGYEEVDQRLTILAIYEAAPPAQREALILYLSAQTAGRSVADTCRQYGRDPNVVRNNFQALKRSLKAKFRAD